jgi:hypothetical protein
MKKPALGGRAGSRSLVDELMLFLLSSGLAVFSSFL